MRRPVYFVVFIACLLVLSLSLSYAYVLWGMKWPVGSNVIYLVNANTAQVADEKQAVVSAATSWSVICPAGLILSYGGATTVTTYSKNNQNTVCWRDNGNSGALATTYAWSSGGVMLETDIVFNDWYNWSTSGGTYDIETVALHEFGHVVGLDHSGSGIMRPSYSGIQRSIDNDARNGFIAMYCSSYPLIGLNKTSLSFTGPGDGTFMVKNAGVGTLDYQIQENISWASASPTSGTSTGEWDTITVHVDTTGLSSGNYSGIINVTSGSAINSPQKLNVTLKISGDTPPSVTITSPQNGDTVFETTNISANAWDDKGVNKVQFFINNSLKKTDQTSPYSYSWNTTSLSNGQYKIKAVATDTKSQTSQHEITVTVKNYKLTITVTNGGTTNPPPGQHIYGAGKEITVLAIANLHYRLERWSGGCCGGFQNPIKVIMDGNKTITAHFLRIIYPPNQFTGRKVENRSLSQVEHIVSLTWNENPNNDGANVVKYKIFLGTGGQKQLLAELPSGTFEYWHRNINKNNTYFYTIVGVNGAGREGDPATVTVN